MPTIAVVMPAYNAGPWIDETLISLLAQTRPADEVIVVDDGSTDDTAARASAHGSRITLIQRENGGPPAAYNVGFDNTSSEYVAMCPADDIWEPRKLEWQAAALEADPDIDVLFARARYFGLHVGDHPHPPDAGRQDPHAFLRMMYAADLIAAPTAVVRRDLHQRVGRFDETLPSEDYEFWLRALREGATFHYDPRTMVHLRQHGGNVSSRALEISEMNHHIRQTYAADVADPKLSRRLMARDLRIVARCRFGLERVVGAREAYAASLRTRPSLEGLVGAGLLSVAPIARALSWLNQRRPRRS
jgi:teichuronic acid biosynthesis glycosyltransferase TuaG